jgi:hypothetical protein
VRAAATLRRSAFVPASLPVAGARSGSSASRRSAVTRAQFSDDANLELSGFGEHVFKGAVASRFLGKYGENATLLDTAAWTKDKSDIVASAILDWARENGASVYVHWFQPMGSSGFRHGQSGQVYNTMVEFDHQGVPRWKVSTRGGRSAAAPQVARPLHPNCKREACIAPVMPRSGASGRAQSAAACVLRVLAPLRCRCAPLAAAVAQDSGAWPLADAARGLAVLRQGPAERPDRRQLLPQRRPARHAPRRRVPDG